MHSSINQSTNVSGIKAAIVLLTIFLVGYVQSHPLLNQAPRRMCGKRLMDTVER